MPHEVHETCWRQSSGGERGAVWRSGSHHTRDGPALASAVEGGSICLGGSCAASGAAPPPGRGESSYKASGWRCVYSTLRMY